jgi:hypothetical protein
VRAVARSLTLTANDATPVMGGRFGPDCASATGMSSAAAMQTKTVASAGRGRTVRRIIEISNNRVASVFALECGTAGD